MLIVYFLIIAAVIAADQVTKALISGNFEPGESLDLIKGVFRFTYVRNEGAAFGMLADKRWIFIVLSTIGIAAVIFYVVKYRPDSKWLTVALALITGGGIGNMIDRLRLKYVVDFLDFYAFGELWKWVFNVADAAVCIGGAMLALWFISDTVAEIRREKQAKAGDAGNSGESFEDKK